MFCSPSYDFLLFSLTLLYLSHFSSGTITADEQMGMASNSRTRTPERDDVEVNRDDMEVNRDDVEVNRDDVEVNRDDVEVNRDDVEVNRDDVEVNRDDVEVNRDDVEVNRDDVEVNRDDVEVNRDDVEVNRDDVEVNRDEDGDHDAQRHDGEQTPRAKKRKSPAELIKPMLPPCSCNRKCLDRIPEDRCVEIHAQFWALPYDRRRVFIFGCVKQVPKKRRRVREDSIGGGNRKASRYYKLQDIVGEEKIVCKIFFLNTLGYTADKIISVTLSSVDGYSDLSPPPDKRGRHAAAHKLSADKLSIIVEHINSYHPSVGHYRRNHAPLRRYLPPELSIREMYDDFKGTVATKHTEMLLLMRELVL